ncbi:MoaD/ThiS family protein [Thermocrinis minervae]|uniref:Sulfur carrier protein n=1 Tax=Thermocrinis minervae TaxID=381751 RepID=A0A1M6R5R1_9AQUI|nr:MoaD/ThiS family protein [Thermocrinis minervae]SHK27815.1 sulfur carrier protein [Thermocrinis minervae]
MKLTVEFRGKQVELEFEKDKVTALDVLKALGLSREYAFVVKNSQIADEKESISPEDKVKVVSAISGG